MAKTWNWITLPKTKLPLSTFFQFSLSYTHSSVHRSLSAGYQGDFESCFRCDNQVSAWADSLLDSRRRGSEVKERRAGIGLINHYPGSWYQRHIHISHRSWMCTFPLSRPACRQRSPRLQTCWLLNQVLALEISIFCVLGVCLVRSKVRLSGEAHQHGQWIKISRNWVVT